jgi:hypothetical protein
VGERPFHELLTRFEVVLCRAGHGHGKHVIQFFLVDMTLDRPLLQYLPGRTGIRVILLVVGKAVSREYAASGTRAARDWGTRGPSIESSYSPVELGWQG